jgi:hypothetical protein
MPPLRLQWWAGSWQMGWGSWLMGPGGWGTCSSKVAPQMHAQGLLILRPSL